MRALLRRYLLAAVVGLAALATVCSAQIHNAPGAGVPAAGGTVTPPSGATATLKAGAGGFLRGVNVANDGTLAANTDTFGAYILNSITGVWDQQVTTTRMPVGVQTPLRADGVYSITLAPSNSSRVYMAYLNQIYRSDNKGASYTLPGNLNKVMSPNNGVAQYGPKMAVDPINPDIVAVCVDNAGAFYSRDAGATWTQFSGVAGNSIDGLCAIAFDSSGGTSGSPLRTNNILIAVYGTGVYRGTATVTGALSLLAGTPTTPSRLKVTAGGIGYITLLDETKLWKLVGTTFTDVTPAVMAGQVGNVLLDPITAGHITAFEDSAYFVDSVNGGTSWNAAGTNFAHTRITNDIPYLGTLFPSITGGSQQSFNFSVGDLVTSPITGVTWMTGGQAIFTTGAIQPAANQVFTSNSVGIEQLVADQVLSCAGINPLLISWDTPVLVSSNPTVFPTTAPMNTTVEVNRGSSADCAKNNSSYIGVIADQRANGSGFSTDAGATFTNYGAIPDTGSGGGIAVATSTNSVVAKGSNGDLFNTTNGGAAWNKLKITGIPNSGNSTSSNPLTVGSKTFAIINGTGLNFPVGNTVTLIETNDFNGNEMFGTVTSYTGASLVVNVTAVNGSGGPYTSWAVLQETGWSNDANLKRFIVSAGYVPNGGGFYPFATYNYGPTGFNSAAGIYTSADGGATWAHAYTGWLSDIPSSGDNSFNAKLRFVPGTSDTLFFTGGPQGGPGDTFPHNQSFWKIVLSSGGTVATPTRVANVLEVWDFNFGKAIAGGPPALYVVGWVGGVGGIFRSDDLGGSWTQLSGLYPTGWLDTLISITGDPNTAGWFYFGFNGSGFGYGHP